MTDIPDRIGAALDAIEELHTHYMQNATHPTEQGRAYWLARAAGLRDACNEINIRMVGDIEKLFAGDNQ